MINLIIGYVKSIYKKFGLKQNHALIIKTYQNLNLFMKNTLSVLILFVVLGILPSFSPPKKMKFLVFSKTAGWRHDSIEAGIASFKKLAEDKKFEVDFSEDSNVITSENLKQYHAVVFLNTTGDIFNEEQQEVFKKYIQSGNGFVGIHAATDTEYNWPWFGEMVGAYFLDHPNNPNVKPGKFIVIHKNHWATRHMPDEFMHTDEFYNFKNLSTKVNHVLKIDETSYSGGKNPEFHPMSWYHNYDGGRAFYTALGHTKECYTDPLFLEHVWAGLQYAAGKIKQ
jgi:type 1 glutamine amidotransferase